ncbi:18520_t:CDS:1, partial [Gigaspora margarita]
YVDKMMVNRDWSLIDKAREVAVTRAFVLRVAVREGWDVAAEM